MLKALDPSSLQRWQAPRYSRTQRTDQTYRTVARRCAHSITRLVDEYKTTIDDHQQLREVRNDIDYYLRRYHEYCIRQRDGMGAHYREIGADDDVDFEHLIPAARIRDMLLSGVITVEQALNAPTVILSRAKHRLLKESGWASHTPDMWFPFHRYTQIFSARFETHDGTAVDPDTWTLSQHYTYFQHLVVDTRG